MSLSLRGDGLLEYHAWNDDVNVDDNVDDIVDVDVDVNVDVDVDVDVDGVIVVEIISWEDPNKEAAVKTNDNGTDSWSRSKRDR